MIGDIMGLIGGEKAEDAQAKANQQAMALQQEQYRQGLQMLQPYRQAGKGAMGTLSRLYGLGGQPADFSAFTESPDYQFARDQGLQGVERSAAARGGLFSGAAGKALQGYGQGLASQQFSDYFNRMSGLAGQGQNAAATSAGYGQNYASNMGNLYGQRGQNAADMVAGQFQGYGNIANQLISAAAGGAGGGGAGGAAGAAGFAKTLFGMQ